MDNPIGYLALDRDASEPLFSQMASAIARSIATGALARGMRLPTVRALAAEFGVNRATVQRAYRTLEQRGLVASRVGSGTEVIAEDPNAFERDGRLTSAPGFSRGIIDLSRAVRDTQMAVDDDVIDFAMLLPDVALFPRSQLLGAVERAVGRGDEVLQYGAAGGLASLRRAVARRLRNQGIDAAEDDIVIVNGIQQALDLLAKTLIERGDAVVVESPTYANVLPLLKLYGARVLSVPLDADGIDLERLDERLTSNRPKLLYTMPSLHNPTGKTMTLDRRRALLDLCARRATPVVEDGCEQDLHFGAQALPPLSALAGSGGASVVHMGTFSKGLFPGLRLGYIVARGELRAMLLLAKRFSDYHADLLSQAVLAEILESGDYDRHLERLRTTYRERMARTVAALSQSLPAEVRFLEPSGGYKAWLELPAGVSATGVADAARQRGVLVLPGGPFFESPAAGEGFVRLSISRTDPARIEDGIGILAEVLRDAIARRARGRSGRRERREAPPLV